MSTLANNKRSCSKKWTISGQNCVFPVFRATNLTRSCHAVLDFREHRGLPPDLFDQARLINCDAGRDRQMKIFPVFGQLFFRKSSKKFFFRARHLVVIYAPREAHCRISFFAQQMLAKKSFSRGDELVWASYGV